MRLNAIVAALAIIFFSPASLALSLGEAQAQSYLNQPLKATIKVSAVKYDERDTIRAIIPDAKKFQRAGVRRDDIVENIQIDITDGAAEDELLIHLRTDDRIQEPFLNFLVEVRWLGGSVIREYTLLLDPASVAESRDGSQDVTTRPLSGAEQGLAPEDDEPPTYSPSSPASSSSSDYSSGERSYGPVKRHETLWSIAYSQRTDPGINMDQMQLAIYQANPQAFDGNMNQMLTGSTLSIPSNSEIRSIDPAYAKREISRQKSRYQPAAPTYTPAPAAKPVQSPPEPEPEPVEEIAEPEISAVPDEDMAAEEESAVEETPAEAPSSSAEQAPATQGSELPPDRAASPATADGEALTQDEMMAEGDVEEAVDEDIEMPSMWAGEEEATAEYAQGDAETAAPPAEAEAEVEAEPVVDEAPSAGSAMDVLQVINPRILLLALVLIVVILATYWWYRRKRVVNVGSQFAYAADDEADTEAGSEAKEGSHAPESESAKSRPTQVWQDYDDMPASIDEYTAGPDAAADSDIEELGTGTETVELEAEESSPIREMSSEEIDYLGEADVHLAYGLYDEAASVLQRGINENPGRDDLRLKLLEVYHSANLADEYVSAAEEWQRSGVQDEQAWQRALQMGASVAPEAALFQGQAAPVAQTQPAPAAAKPEPEAPPVAEKDDIDLSSAFDSPGNEAAESAEEERPDKEEALDFDLSGFDLADNEEEAPATVAEEPEEDSDALTDLDLADLGMDTADEAPDETGSETADSEDPAGDLDFDIGDLSLDESSDSDEDALETPLEEPALEAETASDDEEEIEGLRPADSRQSALDEDFSDDLDLGELEAEESSAPEPELGADADEMIADEPAIDQAGDEEISVKLDLARAYLDMGEPEMAKTLLDEVVDMGNDQQRQEAKDLLSRAG